MSEEGGGAYGLEFGERVREVEHGRPASHVWIREKPHPSGAAVAAAAPSPAPRPRFVLCPPGYRDS